MKYIKKFEKLSEEANIGDYVYIDTSNKDNFSLSPDDLEYATGRIFRITGINTQKMNFSNYNNSDILYTIDHDDWQIFSDDILCSAPTKKELKLKLEELKYNL